MEDDVLHDSSISSISDINQLDGADSITIISDNSQNGDDVSDQDDDDGEESDDNHEESEDDNEQDEESETDYEEDEEAYSAPMRAVLVSAPGPPGAPPGLTVDTTGKVKTPSCLPLAIVTNARSLKMKLDSLRTMLRQIGPDLMTICETFEARRFDLSKSLKMGHYKVISYRRPRPRVGGGAAIIYNEENFFVEEADIQVEEYIEACWAIFTPKRKDISYIKKICVGSIYIAPRSKHKQETVDHIIDVIFQMKARYGNQVNYMISGDFNKYPISDILSANGAIKQVISVPTRKSAVLEVILTDLATLYHPPSSLAPLEVDKGKKGSDSDHNTIVFAPRSNTQFKKDRQVNTISHRPLPPSRIQQFGQDIVQHSWSEVLESQDANQKAANFHNTICWLRDKHFPEKLVRMSSLDKDWMHPDLKDLHVKMTKEYFKNRKTDKWKRLNVKFRRDKRRAIKGMHSEQFAGRLIRGSHSDFYKQVRKVGGLKVANKKLFIASLEGKSDEECAQAIGQEYSAISVAYSPVDMAALPSYLPAQLPPQVDEQQVWDKLKKLKKTKSTFPIDLPEKVRKEFSVELTTPLVDIFNTSLVQGVFPRIWKKELVSPVPKKEYLNEIKDTRKITCLSDYCKLYEGFLKTWILEDISENESFSQFGGKRGVGAEHMLVCMVDRILKLLDTPEGHALVISTQYDWSNAFDRQDPTKTVQKFIMMGVRSSLVPVLIDFLSDRSMQIKFNGKTAGPFDLVGGSPQGGILGGISYSAGSNDNTEAIEVDDEDKYQYVDDLNLLELIIMSDILIQYNFRAHVASDIAVGHRFLPPSATRTQSYNDGIALWTHQNLTKLNTDKSKYMLHTRMKEEFATRFTLDGNYIERQSATKILGVWIGEDPSCWEKNTRQMMKRTYGSMSILTKLKYAGMSRSKLLHIYCLHIRSSMEYCSVVWHDNLTQAQGHSIERLQIVALKIILGADSPRRDDGHFDYHRALVICNLSSLFDRREKRTLVFAKKCIKHPTLKKIFPENTRTLNDPHDLRSREAFHVNYARTEAYKRSAIPSIQRRLNSHYCNQPL